MKRNKARQSKKIYQRFFKRPLDIVLSFCALVVLSPLLIVVAIFVKVKLGSPVIFQQPRPGLHEKIFTLYKFRTMTEEKGADGELLPDSQRLTKFGKMLRSTSIDELPELWNVLKGEMSLIGPRPLLVQYLPLYNEQQKCRHDVRPGVSGLAQISGRNGICWENKFNLDNEYINNIKFIGDCKIILKTLTKVIHKEGISCDASKTMGVFCGAIEQSVNGERI